MGRKDNIKIYLSLLIGKCNLITCFAIIILYSGFFVVRVWRRVPTLSEPVRDIKQITSVLYPGTAVPILSGRAAPQERVIRHKINL